ncbi:hypothetical protein YC2023_056607 [Brassica napus]
MENVSEEDRRLIEEMKGEEAVLLKMSTLTEEGVMAVKNAACERLLDQRVEAKMKSKKINDHLNRFHVAMPKPRDNVERPACIPQVVLEAKAKEAAEKEKRKTEKDLEEENGGAGVYSASLRKHYILHHEEWKEDIMPEILDGHNVADFIDPDILLRLEELEREEEIRQANTEEEDFEMDGEELTEEQKQQLAKIRNKKAVLIREHRLKKTVAQNRSTVPRKFDKDKKYTTKRMGRELSSLGLDPSSAVDRARSKSRGRKRDRSEDAGDDDAMARSQSRPPAHEVVPGEGFKDSTQKKAAIKISNSSHKKRDKNARRGEADRVIPTLRPKHLFSGKRGKGKTDRR